jgi:hypothetical protein
MLSQPRLFQKNIGEENDSMRNEHENAELVKKDSFGSEPSEVSEEAPDPNAGH